MESIFGKRLIAIRKKNGLTRDDLAEKIGMSVNTLRNYENGTREPGHRFIIEMARLFNVSTDYLLGLETEKASESDKPNSEARAMILYKALINLGYLKNGEDITDEQLDVLDAISTIIAVSFENNN